LAYPAFSIVPLLHSHACRHTSIRSKDFHLRKEAMEVVKIMQRSSDNQSFQQTRRYSPSRMSILFELNIYC